MKRASPAYLVNGTDTLYVTNHILLKPKNGVSIDSILAGMNEIVEVVDQTKYGVYTLSVNQGFDVLTYANIIYENGLVDFVILQASGALISIFHVPPNCPVLFK